ncbi:MAG: polysaccharide deacetylase family protein, partial [Acidobacteria bacterium]|nr:polysaccharide deacetylase family protein [Acidobacteriota bacterium]
MKTRGLIFSLLIPLLLFSNRPITMTAQNPTPPVYVTLWFDTEDYVLPQSDDAALRVAEMLTRLGVKATFKVVGEKARTLEQRGRKDVIAELKKHEIGYHSNTHSQQPTIAVYLQNTGWDDGSAEFYRREVQGVKDIQRIFGVTPSCYGQPGAAWAPQTYPALKQMGIPMYLDEGSHIGLDDQPFYYCGMLNVFRMQSTVARMEFRGEGNLEQGKAKFQKAYDSLRSQGGGTISIYYHPCEYIHTEFWDGVNFSRGKNPPRTEWKLPGMKPKAEIEKAFSDFELYVNFIKSQPGVRFVTASELTELYTDRALRRSYNRDDLLKLAQVIQKEISFQKLGGAVLSAADVFGLLTEAMSQYIERSEMPESLKLISLYGPTRPFNPPSGKTSPREISWHAFAEAIRETADYHRNHNRIP